MDKARFMGATALQYFGLSSKEISIDDAASQLVQELIGNDSPNDSKRAAFKDEDHASVSNAAMAALRSMHGGKPENANDQQHMLEKIQDARKKYLKQFGTSDKAKLGADFDDKVKNLLIQKLSVRNRSLYCGQAEKMNQSVQNGTFTKEQCNQEMVNFLKEMKDPTGYSLQTEVMNALSLIGNEKGNVVDGLFYLFKGKIRGESVEKMNLFEQVLEEVLDNKKFDPPEDSNRQAYEREFIARAREQLASRLPEPDKTEYFRFEEEQRRKLNQKTISYDDYRNSVWKWLMDRPLENELKKILNGKSGGEVCKLFADALIQGELYNNRLHSDFCNYKQQPNKSFAFRTADLILLYNNFLGGAYNYIDSKPSISASNKEKYETFMSAAKNILLQDLPENIRKLHEEHVKVIDGLLQNNCIDKTGYEESRTAYLLGLVSSVGDDKNSTPGVAGNDANKSGSSRPNLKETVAEALQKSIRAENKKNDSLEALIMCWGGSVNNHHNDFSLYPLCDAKSTFLQAEKLAHAQDPSTKFRADGEFAIEARAQLVEKLPDDLQKAYRAHEQFLHGHLEKGHITRQTCWRGMRLFLGTHFRR
jgi:hypothetical protein